MNYIDIVALVFFLGLIGIFFAKVYNLMSMGRWYDKRITFLTMMAALVCWLFVWGVVSNNWASSVDPANVHFDLLMFNFASIMMLLSMLLSVPELVMQFSMDTMRQGERFQAGRMLNLGSRRAP